MGYKVRIGLVNNREIDFVAELPGKKLHVQVCYLLTDPKVIDREFGNLLQIKDNHEMSPDGSGRITSVSGGKPYELNIFKQMKRWLFHWTK